MLSLLRLHQLLVHSLPLRLGHSQHRLLVAARPLVAAEHLVGEALSVPDLRLVHLRRQPLVQHQPQPLVRPLAGLVLQLLHLVREEVSFCISGSLHGQLLNGFVEKCLLVHHGVPRLLKQNRGQPCKSCLSAVYPKTCCRVWCTTTGSRDALCTVQKDSGV